MIDMNPADHIPPDTGGIHGVVNSGVPLCVPQAAKGPPILESLLWSIVSFWAARETKETQVELR